jgi:hypothetical protein
MVPEGDGQSFFLEFRHNIKAKPCAAKTNVARTTIGEKADRPQTVHASSAAFR